MKIGVVGPIWLNIPPKGYGGTEDVVYNLVNGLVDKGHAVTLFGPKTAKVKAKLFPTVDLPLQEAHVPWANVCYTLFHITEAFDRAGNFDVLHVHLNKSQDYLSLPLSLFSKTPVVFTIHFKHSDTPDKKDRLAVLVKYRSLPYTSISNSQRKMVDLNYIATVYNGLDLKRFPYSDIKGKYLVWLGRVHPDKGTKEAILAARQAGIKIYVMGLLDKTVPEMAAYFTREIKPLIDDKDVIWLEEVSHVEKTSILSGAIAMLNPIAWEEPFGLVMAEAQAVGTPVISFKRGAAEEVIIDGKTGFLVETLPEMVEKIKEVEYIDRAACRKNVEERFTIEKMVEGYEGAYHTAIQNWDTYKANQMVQIGKQ